MSGFVKPDQCAGKRRRVCDNETLTSESKVLIERDQSDVWMPRRSPIVQSKEIDTFGNIGDAHVAIDDWLERGKFLNPGVNSSGAIRPKQNRVLDHQAPILDRGRRRVTNETLTPDKITPGKARNLTEILYIFNARKLECLLEYGKVFHLRGSPAFSRDGLFSGLILRDRYE